MDSRQVLKRLDAERRELACDGAVIDVLPRVSRARMADNSHRWIAHSSLDAAHADAVIAEQIEHYRRLGVGFEWTVFSHDAPADLREPLQRAGFDIGPLEAVMIYDLSQPAGWIDEDRGDVRCIERLEQIDDFRRVSEAVFEKNRETIANELAASLRAGSPHHRGYIAYSAGRPVSVGRLQTHPQSWFGGLYGGGTLIEFRGQGFYRAVVAARARDAIAIGAKYLRVDALPTSRPILERLGFEWITDTWPCEWRP